MSGYADLTGDLSPSADDTASIVHEDAHSPMQVGERPGDQIGPYKLLSVLGEGGFGVVYLAERREPHVQRVALKIIKPGMDSRAVIARFEAERQALAVMDHPNIAKVFDAGATSGGRPYFVMEHVQGEPITEYCDRHNYTIKQRLELFIPVCEAVQHAHMKGIIHRDIKPSNILVMIKDGHAIPKVIDFGVAKAISHTLTDKTIFTEQGQIIGTPEYMSPEQAEMGAIDIDTRTDVYSLGVVLYELLTGLLPFDPKELRSKGYAEIQRIIREVDPPKPSTRLTSLKDERRPSGIAAAGPGFADEPLPHGRGSLTSVEIARHRQTRIEELARELRRELDWIPLKAMRKDRAQRYATANDFATDIRHYIGGKPLQAGPESATYRVKKFLRRNKRPVAAVMLIITALVAGLSGVAWQWNEARVARDEIRYQANIARRTLSELPGILGKDEDWSNAGITIQHFLRAGGLPDAASGQTDIALLAAMATQWAKEAVAQRDEALRRANELEAVSKFQASQLSTINASSMGIRLRADLLDRKRQYLAQAHHTDAEIANAISELELRLAGVNFTDAALKALHENIFEPTLNAVDVRFADQPLVKAKLLQALAETMRELGMLQRAAAPQAEALEIRRRLLGEEHPDTLISINSMGLLLHSQGKLDEAEPYYREALEKCRRVLGMEHHDTLATSHNLGALLVEAYRLEEANDFVAAALEGRRHLLGQEHPDTMASVAVLANLRRLQRRFTEVETLIRDNLMIQRRVLPPDHSHILGSMNLLVLALQEQGRLEEAEAEARALIDACSSALNAEHPIRLAALGNLALTLALQGKLAEAEHFAHQDVEAKHFSLGPTHPDTLIAKHNLAGYIRDQGRYDEALLLYSQVNTATREALPSTHWLTFICQRNYGDCLARLGRYAEAEVQLIGAVGKLAGR